MKLKNILLSGLSLVLVAALAIGGTIAYLQDSDSDVNVMTLGNVSIEQIEQEYNEAGELVDFTQAKPLMPYVGTLGWENTNNYAYRSFTMNNVVDKYVSVKNTGKSDAYVRTLIAFEMGGMTTAEWAEAIGVSINSATSTRPEFAGTWSWSAFDAAAMVIEVDGHNYVLYVATHQNAVKPGETTIPSLLQVYLSKNATNEDVEKLDGNGNGTYDILVVSQAVQVAGFADAETALNAGFGDITTTNHPWTNTTISSEVGITEAGTYDLKGDVYTIDSAYFHTQKVDAPVTINGNGATVEGIATSIDAFQWEGGTIPAMSAIFSSADGSKVTVNDLKFTGTMSSIMLGNYVNSTYNKFDTELNNVDVIGTEVVSLSAGVSPAVAVYGKAVLNNCNVYGTTLSELDTDPMWPVYDLALTNYTTTTLNNSKVGSIYMWSQANLTIDNNSEVDSIVVLNKVSNKFAITVKGGSTVGVIDLSKIDASYEDKVTITIEDGASVGAFVDNSVSYDTLDAWKAANN